MNGPVEDEFLPVLINIETAILAVYREHPELADYQVESALESLTRTYAGEAKNKPASIPKSPLAQEVFQVVKAICDWQLGRENLVDEEGQPIHLQLLTRDEILAVLKRLRKSVQFWNKESGSQGYLNYIKQFIH